MRKASTETKQMGVNQSVLWSDVTVTDRHKPETSLTRRQTRQQNRIFFAWLQTQTGLNYVYSNFLKNWVTKKQTLKLRHFDADLISTGAASMLTRRCFNPACPPGHLLGSSTLGAFQMFCSLLIEALIRHVNKYVLPLLSYKTREQRQIQYII